MEVSEGNHVPAADADISFLRALTESLRKIMIATMGNRFAGELDENCGAFFYSLSGIKHPQFFFMLKMQRM